jgi:two-component system, NarL family, nitrate/nitrite response regulator NarL
MESAVLGQLTSSIRVLIVDDEPLFVEMVEAMLGAEEGVEIVGTASDGQTGAQLAAELDPDVVVMDISMPVMDGIAATRAICSRDPRACVLILTGGSNVVEIDRARVAGASKFMTKDRIAGELVAQIRELGSR